MIANHDEVSFGLLRYFFGGYRPSKTARLALSFPQIHGVKLDSRLVKTGISTLTPAHLTMHIQSLPVILHMTNQKPIPEYSKGSRGLSVLLLVNSIFTATTISPSLSLRQRPDRYTIRAGRNLPDKEFRYLRHYVTGTFVACLLFVGCISLCRSDHIISIIHRVQRMASEDYIDNFI